MPEMSLEFEVFCANCGAGLCNDSETGRTPRRDMPFVRVKPCSKCMEGEYERGHNEGYAEAESRMDQ